MDISGCLGCAEVSSTQLVVVMNTDQLPATLTGAPLGYFGVGQLGYSAWLNVVSGTPCQFDYDCASSGDNWLFARCGSSGYCTCSDNFIGGATPSDKCRCDSPNNIVWDNGTPYCLKPGVCGVGSTVRVDLCFGFSQNAEFVQCGSNGHCQCQAGFQGSATTSDMCRCDHLLTWATSGPTCSSL